MGAVNPFSKDGKSDSFTSLLCKTKCAVKKRRKNNNKKKKNGKKKSKKMIMSFGSLVRKARSAVIASFPIDFKKRGSIGHLLGFENVLVKAGEEVKSNSTVKITGVDVVNIECNIISGSYINGNPSHTLYSFDPNVVPPGYKISLQPPNVLYLP